MYAKHTPYTKRYMPFNNIFMKNKLSEFFKPIFHNGEEITPSKWVNSFLFLVGIQFIWFLIEVFASFSLNDTFELALSGIIVIYISMTVFFVIKKHRFGWFLLFFEKGLTGLVGLIYLVILLSSGYYIQEEISEYFWMVVISILFLTYLVKKDVYTFFNLDKTQTIKYIEKISIYIVVICVIGFAISQ